MPAKSLALAVAGGNARIYAPRYKHQVGSVFTFCYPSGYLANGWAEWQAGKLFNVGKGIARRDLTVVAMVRLTLWRKVSCADTLATPSTNCSSA